MTLTALGTDENEMYIKNIAEDAYDITRVEDGKFVRRTVKKQ